MGDDKAGFFKLLEKIPPRLGQLSKPLLFVGSDLCDLQDYASQLPNSLVR
jgi:hypothetical protein